MFLSHALAMYNKYRFNATDTELQVPELLPRATHTVMAQLYNIHV